MRIERESSRAVFVTSENSGQSFNSSSTSHHDRYTVDPKTISLHTFVRLVSNIWFFICFLFNEVHNWPIIVEWNDKKKWCVRIYQKLMSNYFFYRYILFFHRDHTCQSISSIVRRLNILNIQCNGYF